MAGIGPTRQADHRWTCPFIWSEAVKVTPRLNDATDPEKTFRPGDGCKRWSHTLI
jgi:hypothetical protein